jgi:peptidoglycan/xylan/chitin deacetylase (PgdA/CDA1 family)
MILLKLIKKLASVFVIRKISSNAIYLTFDDGPHPIHTLKILNILDKHKISASFFMVGQEVEKYPDIAREVQSRGHAVGYHSYNHVNIKKTRYVDLVRDLNKAEQLEHKYNLMFNNLYRPPYGALSFMTLIILKLKFWKVILWSIDSMDSYSDTHDFCEVIKTSRLTDGEIVLMHDDGQNTADNLDNLLEALALNDHTFHKLPS